MTVGYEGDDVGVVNGTVDHGFNGDGVSEDLGPGGEVLVGEHDEGAFFFAGGDKLEGERRSVGVERNVADFVNDEQRDASQASEFV